MGTRTRRITSSKGLLHQEKSVVPAQRRQRSHDMGQVCVRGKSEQDHGQTDTEDDIEQATARRQPGTVGALDPDDGQRQDPCGRPQDGEATMPQQRNDGNRGQAEGHKDDADRAVGLLVLVLPGMRVVSHGDEPIGAWGAGP